MARTKLSQRTYGLPVNPKIGATIFYIAFTLYTIYILISSTGYKDIVADTCAPYFDFFHLLRWAIWGLLGLKLLTQRYNILQALIVIALALLVFVTWRHAGRGLEIFLFIAAGQNIKVRRLAHIALPLTLIILLATITGFLTGFIDNVQLSSDFQDSATGRNSLGFLHPNAFGSFIFAIVLAWLVIKYRTINIVNTIVVLCGAVIVFVVSESETYTIAIVLAGLLHIASLKFPARLLSASALTTIAAIGGFSFYAMLTFDPHVPWWNTLDGFLSHRLTLARHYFLTFPSTLFGQNFESTQISWYPQANGKLLVDNAYCNLWLQYGVIATVIFVVFMAAIFMKSLRENRWNEATFGLFLSVIIGFAETTILRFDANYFLIAASALIFGTSLRSLEMPRMKKSKQSAVISQGNSDE